MVRGNELLKEVMLAYGYTLSADKRSLVPPDPSEKPHIRLAGVNGGIEEVDISDIDDVSARVLYEILVEPTLVRKRAAAMKASRQAMMNRMEKKQEETDRRLQEVREQRRMLDAGPSSSTLPRSPSPSSSRSGRSRSRSPAKSRSRSRSSHGSLSDGGFRRRRRR